MSNDEELEEKAEASRIMENIMAASDEDDQGSQQSQAWCGNAYVTLDICRVCRLAGDKELYHPCQCIGSIKFVHQDCLLKWLKYSKKEVCELCNYKFYFQPVYAKEMPPRLPLTDIAKGIFGFSIQTLRSLFTYLLVGFCWLIFVPLMASRVYKVVFSGNVIAAFFSAKIFQLLAFENVWVEIVGGVSIVSMFLCTFISLVWLREQIMTSAAADFLHLQDVPDPAEVATTPAVDNNVPEELDVGNDVEPVEEEEEKMNDATNGIGEKAGSTKVQPGPSSSNDAFLAFNDTPTHSPNPSPLIQPQIRIPAVEPDNAADEAGVNEEHDDADLAEDERGDVERIVDELTWQRLIGLDGSFVFIEHVFWAVSLNIVFNVLFLYWPEQMGLFILKIAGLTGGVIYFQMPLCILIGYVMMACIARGTHSAAKILRLKMLFRHGPFIYKAMVFLLIVLELVLFPVICGWWLDVCSLPFTGGTLEMRVKTFQSYPSSSTFLHWLIGMVYVFYSTSFILLLKEQLRPGVLWFIRNLNDPEFNPIFEMIDQPVTQHFRRLVSSTTLFFTIVLLVIYAPLRLIRSIFSNVLPYQFSSSADTPLGEFSLELILLQIVMPTVLEYSKAFSIVKAVVRFWCRWVGGMLGLESYLLSAAHRTKKPNVIVQQQQQQEEEERRDVPAAEQQMAAENPLIQADNDAVQQVALIARQNHLAARHQALLMIREPANHEDYEKPHSFTARIIMLLLCLALTAVIVSFSFFLLPVTIGRCALSYLTNSQAQVHDLYTMATGLYICWLAIKIYALSHEWFEKGWSYVRRVFRSTAWLVVRLAVGVIPLLIVIPFLLGLYFQLLVVGPLRASVHQTPLFIPWKEWAMGVVHFKIFCATVMMGPEWWLKAAIEKIYADGVRGFHLRHLYVQLVFPIFNFVSFQLAFPYVMAKTAFKFMNLSREEEIVWTRYSYPLCLLSFALTAFLVWQWTKLKRLVERIRNDKYLIGTQLVNFCKEVQTTASGGAEPIHIKRE